MATLVDALRDARWPFWLGGLAIGLFAVLFAWVTGKALGVSSGFGSLCSLVSGLPIFRKKPFSERWRLAFLVGLPLGGALSAALAGTLVPHDRIGTFETFFGASWLAKVLVLGLGGFLIGYGARLAGG
jgi:uncharacterized protein